MRSVLFFWGFILMTVSAVAQESRTSADPSALIIYARQYNKGLYKSFKDFQTNSPTEDGDLVIKDRSSAAQTYLLADKNQLVIRDGAGEHKVKDYWGYCDGRNLYIKDNGLNRIIETGYYCIYRQHGLQSSRGYVNPADMTVNNISTPVQLVKVINIMTGEIYDLSAYNLRKYILPQDNELLEEFRTDKEKKDKLEYYIHRFNERNRPSI
ncbi:hypothetical protein [Chitinophaga sp. Cy-1792]|uniref:hypothetical protein n=1 Tax=Chitinophaga sp. Cy-1792 TaxID=2608339 RepID=UPI00142116F6|nr:hypothetical protein [Chitinophaga sp. Cy-1792]NIG52417.1 hypothetical protein [Chitinophaga sp. Cy-1792]